MPDQHTAATEHELLAKIAEPLNQLPDDPLAIVSVEFPVALRGYDRFAVDAYVERTAQLVAELQATRSPDAAVRRALERVGEEISGILTRAHDTANEITTRSRAEAEDRLEAARYEATQIAAEAERRVRELDAETERIWAERHSIVTDARELARRLTELAESALERFPADTPPVEKPGVVAAGPVPAHLFDGAVDEIYPPAGSGEYEPTPAAERTPLEQTPLEPTADELAAHDLAADELAADELAWEELAGEEPAEDGLATESLAREDPAAGEEPMGDATVEKPLFDEPTVEHRVGDEPTVAMPPIEPALELPPIEPWEGGPPNPPWAVDRRPAGPDES